MDAEQSRQFRYGRRQLYSALAYPPFLFVCAATATLLRARSHASPDDAVVPFIVLGLLGAGLSYVEWVLFGQLARLVVTLKPDSVSWVLPNGKVVDCPNTELLLTTEPFKRTMMKVISQNGANKQNLLPGIEDYDQLIEALERRTSANL